MNVLIVLAVIAFLGGVTNLSQATMGVGGIASACFFGICARIAQAQRHETARVHAETERVRDASRREEIRKMELEEQAARVE